MRFAVALLQLTDWPELRRRARLAEELGFDTIWVADHFIGIPGAPWMEGWTALAGLAEATSRIRLGTLVSSIVLRPPQMLALQATTVDSISGGRLEIGIGAGAPRDHGPLGISPWSATERQERLEEYVTLVDRLLRTPVTDHRGDHYRAEGAELHRRPVQEPRPPILLGAEAPRSIALAARVADGWNCMSGQPQARGEQPLPFEEGVARAREQLRLLDRACAEAGRDPASVRRSVMAWRIGVEPITDAEAFERFVDAYAAAGFGEFTIGWFQPPDPAIDRSLERIATEVIPRLRA